MARHKVKLAFIENKSKRKATYKKRIEGFMTKVSALSTLCGINICAIVYSIYDPNPRVWPSDMGARSVLSQFLSRSDLDKKKHMLNQEGFLRNRVAKANDLLEKQRIGHREKHIIRLILQCLDGKATVQNLMESDLNDFGHQLEQKLTAVNKRMAVLKGMETLQQVQNPLAPPQQAPLMVVSPTPPPQIPMLMALQQIGPPPTPSLMPTAMQQQVAPLQVQEQNPLPQWFIDWVVDWVNQPTDDMGFGQGEENQDHHALGK